MFRDLLWLAFLPKYLIIYVNRSYKKINRLPLGYFHKVSQGEILSRITNDVDTLSQSLNQSVTQLITSVTSMIGVLIMMLSISWQLTLVALCILPLSLLLVMGVVKKVPRVFQRPAKVSWRSQWSWKKCMADIWWSRRLTGRKNP